MILATFDALFSITILLARISSILVFLIIGSLLGDSVLFFGPSHGGVEVNAVSDEASMPNLPPMLIEDDQNERLQVHLNSVEFAPWTFWEVPLFLGIHSHRIQNFTYGLVPPKTFLILRRLRI